MSAKTIGVANQKGGVSKTFTTVSLGIGLARQGKKVLLVDCDPQGSLTISLGLKQPSIVERTLATLMDAAIDDVAMGALDVIKHHEEGIDFIPANRNLSMVDMKLVGAMSREMILKQCLNAFKDCYDYILMDCLPSLGMLAINVLAAADSTIIPAQPQFLSMKGLEELLQTYAKVRRQINPALRIDGILLTMVNSRTNNTKEIIQALDDAYGDQLNIFDTHIPQSVRAAETTALGVSIFSHEPDGKIAKAYDALAKEVIGLE